MKALFSISTFFTPIITFAYGAPKDLIGVSAIVKGMVDIIVPILFLGALVGFLYGVGKFISSAGSEEGRESGRQIMFWGVIALFVMASIWSILSLAAYTFSF